MGIKIGRYHIYLPRMLKPKAVEFRVGLWKIFYNLSDKNKIPKSGLNFITGSSLEKVFFYCVDLKNLGNFSLELIFLKNYF